MNKQELLDELEDVLPENLDYGYVDDALYTDTEGNHLWHLMKIIIFWDD